jgi:hypothetical protein
MCVTSGFRRGGPAPTGGFINRDPHFELSRELAAQQTLLDQLQALAAEDPDSHARQSAAEAAMSGGVAASAQTRNRSNILRRQYDRMIDATVKMAPIARFSASVCAARRAGSCQASTRNPDRTA